MELLSQLVDFALRVHEELILTSILVLQERLHMRQLLQLLRLVREMRPQLNHLRTLLFVLALQLQILRADLPMFSDFRLQTRVAALCTRDKDVLTFQPFR